VRDDTLVLIVAMICITVLQVVNALTMRLDGNILSAVVGAIVFIATRQYYKAQRRAQKR
jgi:F0F1-type ATP synthase assembly protein I